MVLVGCESQMRIISLALGFTVVIKTVLDDIRKRSDAGPTAGAPRPRHLRRLARPSGP